MKRRAAKIANVALRKSSPASLIHFITNRCNARCGHCFIDFEDEGSQKERMRLEDVETLTRSLGPQVMNVNLTGGEPFLSPDITAIAEAYLRNSAIDSVYITTHGGLTERIGRFVEAVAPRFPEAKIIVSISIDHLGERHDRERKVPNLFSDALASYRLLQDYGRNVLPNVSITVSQSNCADVDEVFDGLVSEHGVRSITSNIVRDEGAYTTPRSSRQQILDGYRRLNARIQSSRSLVGYDPDTRLGRMMNRKEAIMVRHIEETWLEPRYVLPCRSGALLGVIHPNGDVFPCEILADRPMGNLRDHDFDLMRLWASPDAEEVRRWIRATRCNCSFECAWSFNILGSPRYQLSLVRAAISG
ncbi:MAG: radical SAM protein [Proteobacteria bacterium]|nr:radical SAM protein [Pseudomonadota bacterium]